MYTSVRLSARVVKMNQLAIYYSSRPPYVRLSPAVLHRIVILQEWKVYLANAEAHLNDLSCGIELLKRQVGVLEVNLRRPYDPALYIIKLNQLKRERMLYQTTMRLHYQQGDLIDEITRTLIKLLKRLEMESGLVWSWR